MILLWKLITFLRITIRMSLTLRQQNQIENVRDPVNRRKLLQQYRRQNNGATINQPRNQVLRPTSRRGRRGVSGRFRGDPTPPRNTRTTNPMNPTRFARSSGSAPNNLGTSMTAVNNTNNILTGEAIIASVSHKETAIDMHPLSVPWLRTMCNLYDFWKWRNISITFVSNVPTTTSGSIGLAWDYDSGDGEPSTRDGVVELSTSSGFVMSPVWKNSAPTRPNMALCTDRWFSTVPYEKKPNGVDDFRESVPARLKYAHESTLETIGYLVCKYKIEFKGRKKLNPNNNPTIAEDDVVSVHSGF